MGDSFFAYLQQIELMAFFSGYPLIYAVLFSIAGNKQQRNDFKNRIVTLLPFAYALIGTLYLGLQLRNLYPDYSVAHIKQTILSPYLISWALLSMLFWIPALAKRTVLSLIHSLVFFFFLARDLFLQLRSGTIDNDYIRNDMKIYTVSLLLNLAAIILIVLLYSLYTHYNRKRMRS